MSIIIFFSLLCWLFQTWDALVSFNRHLVFDRASSSRGPFEQAWGNSPLSRSSRPAKTKSIES